MTINRAIRTRWWVVFCAALLTACGGGSGGNAPTRLQVFGDPAELAGYRALIAAYEKAHPGQRVELLPVGKQRDHMAKLSTAFAGGDPPDLFILNFRRFGQFAAKGALAPLGPQMTASGQFVADDFHAPAVDAFRYRGTLYCLPQNVSSLVVYYNRKLFQRFGVPEPADGWSYNDFLTAAKKLTRDTDGDGTPDTYGAGLDPTLIRLAPFIWGLGGSLVNNLENPSLMLLDRGPAQVALGAVKNLMSLHQVVPPLAQYQAENNDARFARGGLAMLFQSRRYTATLRELDVAKSLDWDVAPFPLLVRPVSSLHADAYCMAAKSQRPEAARAFVAYALSEPGQQILAASGRTVPSRKTVAQSPAFLDATLPPARSQVFLDAIPLLKRTPNTAAWHEVESRADVLLEEWFFEPPLPGEAGESQILIAHQIRDAVQPLLLEDLQRNRPASP